MHTAERVNLGCAHCRRRQRHASSQTAVASDSRPNGRCMSRASQPIHKAVCGQCPAGAVERPLCCVQFVTVASRRCWLASASYSSARWRPLRANSGSAHSELRASRSACTCMRGSRRPCPMSIVDGVHRCTGAPQSSELTLHIV